MGDMVFENFEVISTRTRLGQKRAVVVDNGRGRSLVAHVLAEHRDGKATGKLFILLRGELIEQDSQEMLLSEAFAPQHGWIVNAQNCSWQEGLGER